MNMQKIIEEILKELRECKSFDSTSDFEIALSKILITKFEQIRRASAEAGDCCKFAEKRERKRWESLCKSEAKRFADLAQFCKQGGSGIEARGYYNFSAAMEALATTKWHPTRKGA